MAYNDKMGRANIIHFYDCAVVEKSANVLCNINIFVHRLTLNSWK